ncbi:hypothetical protein SORBI_3002G073250 [Sorghum bicolor]|uniref:Uncharacterized protein n=1 Tax=Sorghum bicolor TaxID=4558 RepID=A0A1W0W2S7_SORBI|nr:hypothetical protein SORBI_3002G073250 [Sorghum bicolor]
MTGAPTTHMSTSTSAPSASWFCLRRCRYPTPPNQSPPPFLPPAATALRRRHRSYRSSRSSCQ